MKTLPSSETLLSLSVCNLCPIRGEAEPVGGDGVVAAKMAVILRRATREDALYGIPASDPAGQQLRAAVREAGWGPGDVYYTCATKCAPKEVPPAKPKCPADCRSTCTRTWLVTELAALPSSTTLVFVGQATLGDVFTNCGELLVGRPLRVVPSEATLLTGGKNAYDSMVSLFKSIRETKD